MMKRRWTFVAAILLLLSGVAAERVSDYYAKRLRARRKTMTQELDTLRERTLRADAERKESLAIVRLANDLRTRIRWEDDSTDILRSIAQQAADLNVRLSVCKLEPTARVEDVNIVEGFIRSEYTLHAEGLYGAVVQFVERVERSPHVILIETLTLQANKDDDGTGELRMKFSTLCPSGAPLAVVAAGKTP